MLKKGDHVENFELPDETGNPTALQDLLADGELILYFYPADFTPGCTTEACGIRDIHDEIIDVGIKIVGISPQNPASHQRFIKRHDLPFTLLCDPKKRVIRKFGVDGPLGLGVRRATFLINQEGQIENRVTADFLIGSHMSFIKKIIGGRSTV